MSISREARCIFCSLTRTVRQQPITHSKRAFTNSSTPSAKRSQGTSDGIPKIRVEKSQSIAQENWKEHFSPEQRAAIEAADKVLGSSQLETAKGDTKPWSLKYYDDLSKIDPVIDKPVKAPWANLDDDLRLKNDEELNEDLYNFMQNLPEDSEKAAQAWEEFDQNMRLTMGKEEAERNPPTALTPDLPKLGDARKPARRADGNKGEDRPEEKELSPELLRLMQMTGYSRKQISKLRVKQLIMKQVTNQTRLGKINSAYCLSVAGNGNGLIGIGEGKAAEFTQAVTQAQYRAIRNMAPILRYENRTIFGDVKGKVSATELELYARPPGFGLRCQQYIFEICRAAGISDLAARVTRSRNPMNTIKATVQALLNQKDPEEIARARGKKLVDVRKVYYANQV